MKAHEHHFANIVLLFSQRLGKHRYSDSLIFTKTATKDCKRNFKCHSADPAPFCTKRLCFEKITNMMSTMTFHGKTRTSCAILLTILVLECCRVTEVHGFAPRSRKTSIPSLARRHMADLNVSQPSPDAAAAQGIREWPQQTTTGSWLEDSEDGELLTRYVLEGTGTVEIEADGNTRSFNVAPGTLVEVDGKATLSWKASSQEMIILTPGFEQGGVFAAVAVVVLILFGSLIALS